jgi:hypothetical protein
MKRKMVGGAPLKWAGIVPYGAQIDAARKRGNSKLATARLRSAERELIRARRELTKYLYDPAVHPKQKKMYDRLMKTVNQRLDWLGFAIRS